MRIGLVDVDGHNYPNYALIATGAIMAVQPSCWWMLPSAVFISLGFVWSSIMRGIGVSLMSREYRYANRVE